MRILFISDPHLSPSNDFYLENVLERENYDIILSAGDLDEVPKHFKKYGINTIYGNHDDVELLAKRTNLLNELKNPAGANVVQVGDLVACVLGGAVVRDNYSYPETWHTPEDYLQGYFVIKKKLQNEYGKCDVLITHDSPLSLVEFEKQHISQKEKLNVDYKSYRDVFDVIAKLLSPKLYLCGHVHSTSVTTSIIKNFDIYSNTADVPVVKNIFMRDKIYTVIDLQKNKVEARDWFGNLIDKIELYNTKIIP